MTEPEIEDFVYRRYATWFGTSGTLLGHLDSPGHGRCRGGVVICPPLGKEYVDSYRALVLLAQDCAAAGLLTLRFDYPGTGDSGEPADAEAAVAAWLNSIVDAVKYLRNSGIQDIALVGLRTGGLLAAHAAAQLSLRALVLWDPEVSGNHYLRRQRAIYRLAVHDPEPPPHPVVGIEISPATAADLKSLSLAQAARANQQDARPVLLCARETDNDATVDEQQRDWSAEVIRVAGQELLLEPADYIVEVPRHTTAAIAGWLSKQFGLDVHQTSPTLTHQAVVGTTSSGGAIIETIAYLGPNALFALRTSALTTGADGTADLLLYGTAGEHRCGPMREWVVAARTLSQLGISTVRFDRRGTGESGTAQPGDRSILYSNTTREDALDAASAVRRIGSPLILAGMCSGGWHAAYAAINGGAHSVVLINMLDFALTRRKFARRATTTAVTERHTRIGSARDRAHLRAVAIKRSLRDRVSYASWMRFGRWGLIQVPEILLGALNDAQVRTVLAMSPSDWDTLVDNRGLESLARLRADNWDGIVRLYDYGDHSLYSKRLREAIRSLLSRSVLEAMRRTHESANTADKARRAVNL